MLINIGPQHPATHGVLRLVLELDGETVRRCIPHIGYLHSGFEKLGEYRHYNQIIPLTDRTDYLSPMANNVCLALAAEKLMGIEITERCQVLRVIACEMSRIISHLVWLGTTGIDLGAFTPFLWAFQRARADLQPAGSVDRRAAHHEPHAGGRHDGRHSRRLGGGPARLLPHLPEDAGRGRHDVHPQRHLVRPQRRASGVISAEDAINCSLSGPMLRASGVPFDVRKDRPYLGYETYDFDVPVGEHGDIYDRYLVRMEEMRQSVRILEQALDAAQARARSTWTTRASSCRPSRAR